MRFRITVDGEDHDIDVQGSPPSMTVRVDGVVYRARVRRESAAFRIQIGTRRHTVVLRGREILVDDVLHQVTTEHVGTEESRPAEGGGSRAIALVEIRPPMPGRVVKLPVSPGETVKRGQVLAVLEAMKMQNEIPSPADGVLMTIGVREGESIAGDRVIATLETR
jgi:biotin carboxyl carrier protein